jgi:hypothetical protein
MRAFFTVSMGLLAAAASLRRRSVGGPGGGARRDASSSIAPHSGNWAPIGANGKSGKRRSQPGWPRLYVAREDRSERIPRSATNSGSSNEMLRFVFARPGIAEHVFSHRAGIVWVAFAGWRLPLHTRQERCGRVRCRYLEPLAHHESDRAYNLQPSPDGRWLLGVTNSPNPSLDIFDMNSMSLARRLPIPATGPFTGAWAGDRFYLFQL